MKYIVILGDGMADLPVKELGDKTPLDCAKHPNMDFIAENGICLSLIHIYNMYSWSLEPSYDAKSS